MHAPLNVLSHPRSRKLKGTSDKIWGNFNDASDEAEVNTVNCSRSTSSLISESTELLTSVETPVYLLDYGEAMKLECGDKVQVFPDQAREHFMSRNQETPSLVVSSAADVEFGVLNSFYGASDLCLWLLDETYGVKIAATVSSCISRSGDVEVTLTLKIYAPKGVRAMYLPRMRWALSNQDLDEFSEQLDIPQGPPPQWQLSCLLDHGLTTFVSANSNWTQEPNTLDLYTSTELAPLPNYTFKSQALRWALQQEDPKTTESEVQFWVKVPNRELFRHKVLREQCKPQDLMKRLGRGGLLADDMGKTLTMLALIAVSLDTKISGYSKATLIVAPLSVLTTWENEIERRCPSLKYTIYHPAGRKAGNNTKFADCDVVLTNYESLRKQENPLSLISWRRVVLDEAHNVRNKQTVTHKAVIQLKAHARWALTGTPIINSLKDVGAIVAFLRIEYYQDWDSRIGAGNKLNSHSMSDLQMRDANGKRILPLPKCTYQGDLPDHHDWNGSKTTGAVPIASCRRGLMNRITFQSLYDSVATSGRAHLKRILDTDSKGLAENMLTVILRLRQIVLHPTLVPSEYVVSWINSHKNPEVHCMLRGDWRRRPLHQQEVHTLFLLQMGAKLKTDLYTRGEEEAELPGDNEDAITRGSGSAKLEALVALLKQTPQSDKCLVFSSFVKFLKIVELRLKQENVKCFLYSGEVTVKRRNESIAKFSDPETKDGPRVMLISLLAGAFGLNLTVANHVFLMDPWWQPSIERQAIDRVNRIGQTKEVKVFRLVAKDSIEEKVLEIQSSKMALIRTVLSDAKTKGTTSYTDFKEWTSKEPGERSQNLLVINYNTLQACN
ncbi:P-loop containing nucleoside triphosphate hydrolase protein [Mycena pura]|uniref:P-loop containing nucleoside triphosphate hydrolase protein n=1 Tax=Mycena pura TaxID=153505 RepID=A0AAD6Y643_9AGAR|nr:P-loop containing nucleoside triphosphate hydrolase protein [Mycena pura]